MKNLSTLFALLLVVPFVAVGAGNALGAGSYPEKPITLIVHSSAGGGSDIFARTLASAIEKEKLLPKPIVVENKPGGSGGIALRLRGRQEEGPLLYTHYHPVLSDHAAPGDDAGRAQGLHPDRQFRL